MGTGFTIHRFLERGELELVLREKAPFVLSRFYLTLH